MNRFIMLVGMLFFGTQSLYAAEKDSVPVKLIDALIAQESCGDDNAVGDKSLVNKAYGCLQIRQPCVDDVNRRFGTKYRAEECLGNRALSVWIFNRYMEIYATELRLGHKPTMEEMARIWNGGPNGHKKASTEGYWQKVKKLLL